MLDSCVLLIAPWNTVLTPSLRTFLWIICVLVGANAPALHRRTKALLQQPMQSLFGRLGPTFIVQALPPFCTFCSSDEFWQLASKAWPYSQRKRSRSLPGHSFLRRPGVITPVAQDFGVHLSDNVLAPFSSSEIGEAVHDVHVSAYAGST
jgi:hypothetical protein